MGGVLSGYRGWRGGKRPTAALPVVRLTHADTYTLDPRPAYIRIDGHDFGTVVHGSQEWLVCIECTPLHFGGSRRWLVCPCCQTRRQALYIDGKVLACRVCLGLRYESNHENRRQLALRKADRMRAVLGWKPGILNPAEGKPKHMHWSTFQSLTTELDARTDALLGALPDWIDRLERSIERRRAHSQC
jgi:hypothetical protein